MIIHNLQSLKDFFQEVKNPIFGVAVFPFERLGLEEIVKDYRLLSLRWSLDSQLIERDIEIFSLEKGMGRKHLNLPRNSTTVLTHEKTRNYLRNFQKPVLLTYNSSKKMEGICKSKNWILAAPPVKFGKNFLENKIEFRDIAKSCGASVAPGEIFVLKRLKWKKLVKDFGLPFIIQHPTRGGGKGTFLIKNFKDFKNSLQLIKKEDEEDVQKVSKVLVTKFISGPSPSIIGCATRHGILSTPLQFQVLSQKELYNKEGFGLFCGHDFTSSRFSESIEAQAYSMVRSIGKKFQSLGYKGIFGLDFVLDEKEGRLYLTECNPRLTGAFPTLTFTQIENHEPPLIAFHILEYLNLDYKIDFQKIETLLHQKKEGTQMFMHNLEGRIARNKNEFKAGVYKIDSQDNLIFVRDGYKLSHLEDSDEFLICDGVPFLNSYFSANRRICRILTRGRILNDDYKSLNSFGRKIANVLYKNFKMKPISLQFLIPFIRFFNPNYLAKL